MELRGTWIEDPTNPSKRNYTEYWEILPYKLKFPRSSFVAASVNTPNFVDAENLPVAIDSLEEFTPITDRDANDICKSMQS